MTMSTIGNVTRYLKVSYMILFLKKIAGKEQIGINLFYCNGTEGISLKAANTSQIILSITINRKTIKGKYTDMSWYLENIIYKFLSSDVRLLSYKIEEYED